VAATCSAWDTWYPLISRMSSIVASAAVSSIGFGFEPKRRSVSHPICRTTGYSAPTGTAGKRSHALARRQASVMKKTHTVITDHAPTSIMTTASSFAQQRSSLPGCRALIARLVRRVRDDCVVTVPAARRRQGHGLIGPRRRLRKKGAEPQAPCWRGGLHRGSCRI
jgi:hypothetical protein